MSKCFVTNYPGVINNSSLLKVGEMLLKVTPKDASHPVQLSFNENVELYSQDGSNVMSRNKSGGSLTNRIVCKNTDDAIYVFEKSNIIVKNKYNIKNVYFLNYDAINFIDFDLKDLAYSKDFHNIKNEGSCPALNSDISAFKNLAEMDLVHIENSGFTGDISVFSDHLNMTTIEIESKNISGDISSFANLVALTKVKFTSPLVTGNIKSLCSSLFANGKKSGSIVFNVTNTGILLDTGTPVTDKVTATFSSSEVTYQIG